MIDLLPVEALLMEYAAGSLTPYEALMVAAHMTLRPDARKKAAQFEAEGGKAITEVAPSALSGSCLEKVLQKIDCGGLPSPCGKKETLPADINIPEPIYSLLKRSCINNPKCWSQMGVGIEVIELKVCSSEPRRRKLRLMRLKPDIEIPSHSHEGREMMLVLEGGFSDQTGHYNRGDLAVYANSAAHAPKAGGTGCLCIMLTEAPLKFERGVLRIFNIFWRV